MCGRLQPVVNGSDDDGEGRHESGIVGEVLSRHTRCCAEASRAAGQLAPDDARAHGSRPESELGTLRESSVDADDALDASSDNEDEHKKLVDRVACDAAEHPWIDCSLESNTVSTSGLLSCIGERAASGDGAFLSEAAGERQLIRRFCALWNVCEDDAEFWSASRTQRSLRYGFPIFAEEHVEYCTCGERLDAQGVHALACGKWGAFIWRHDEIRDELWRAAKRGMLRPRREVHGLLSGTDARPADILLPAFKGGRDYAIDVTVVTPFSVPQKAAAKAPTRSTRTSQGRLSSPACRSSFSPSRLRRWVG